MRIPRPQNFLVAFTLAAAFLVACQNPSEKSAERPDPTRPRRQYTIEELMDNARISGASFSSDESTLLVSSDETGIVNAYRIDTRSAIRSPVTRSTTDSTYAVSYFPNDNRVLVTHDQAGNERNHLYLIDLDGKERDLTPGTDLKASFAGWSRDERSFYLKTNERDKRFFDLYRTDVTNFNRTLIYEDKTGYQIGPISDDEQWLALEKPNTTSDSDLYVFNLATRELKHISQHSGAARYSPAEFDHENKHLYYLSDDGDEFTRVRRYEMKSGRHEDVERASWDILFTQFSYHGKYRVTGINEDGRTVIKVIEHATGRKVKLPELPGGEVNAVAISRSEDLMAFYLRGDRSPSNLHVYNFVTGEIRKLTETLSKRIDPADLVTSQVVRFRSFDGMEIPNILYRPHQATRQAKAPALVWVHGGPGGQTRKGYSPDIQHLVNHGYVILGINNRGSSGYGKTFFTADDRKHGREPLWDCVEAKRYLAGLDYVDPNRIGIIGGSYGGYMVLAALAYQPEVFKCGVDIFGVANWLRTLKNTPPWWESFKKALYQELGDPATDEAMLREISPVFHADQIRRPLLVLQGANDPRVLKAESDDIVAAIQKNGVPVEYVVFDDEGHGFSKKKNQISGAQATLSFLDKYLKGK